MAEIKEIHKEKIIYDHENGSPLSEHHVHETVAEHREPVERILYEDGRPIERIVKVEKVVYEDGHEHLVRDGHGHLVPEDRRDHRTRRAVRSEILSFRRGAYMILNILQIVLIARFIVELFALSNANPFAAFIRLLSYPLTAPFGNIVTYVAPYLAINWSILVALLVYALITWLVVNLFEGGIRSAYRRH